LSERKEQGQGEKVEEKRYRKRERQRGERGGRGKEETIKQRKMQERRAEG